VAVNADHRPEYNQHSPGVEQRDQLKHMLTTHSILVVCPSL